LGPATLRKLTLNFSTGFSTGSQSENNTGMVSSKFSRLCYFTRMPPILTDHNALDYAIWSILETHACRKPHKSLEALKKSLLIEWDSTSPEELHSTAENFTKHLKLCIEAEEGYFENT